MELELRGSTGALFCVDLQEEQGGEEQQPATGRVCFLPRQGPSHTGGVEHPEVSASPWLEGSRPRGSRGSRVGGSCSGGIEGPHGESPPGGTLGVGARGAHCKTRGWFHL